MLNCNRTLLPARFLLPKARPRVSLTSRVTITVEVYGLLPWGAGGLGRSRRSCGVKSRGSERPRGLICAFKLSSIASESRSKSRTASCVRSYVHAYEDHIRSSQGYICCCPGVNFFFYYYYSVLAVRHFFHSAVCLYRTTACIIVRVFFCVSFTYFFFYLCLYNFSSIWNPCVGTAEEENKTFEFDKLTKSPDWLWFHATSGDMLLCCRAFGS